MGKPPRQDYDDADEEQDLAAQSAERDALDTLRKMGIDGVLQAGHEAAIRLLVAKAIAGTATHQELAILRNILRDNGMMLGKVMEGKSNTPPPLPKPEDIPHLAPPDYDYNFHDH